MRGQIRRLAPLTVLVAAALTASAEMRITRDIPYAEHPGANTNATSLDVYAPADGARHPVLVYIHGGGWCMGDKAHVRAKPEAFTDAGYVFVSINYRLTPAVQHPVHIEDVAAAIAWVCKNIAEHGGDPDRLFVLGHSAGAHLAALVATDARRLGKHDLGPDNIKGVISLDTAAYDIPRNVMEFGGVRAEEMFTAAFTEDTRVWEDASPIAHVKEGETYPAFLLVHAGNRDPSREIAQDFAAAIREAGGTAELHAAPDRNHRSLNQNIGLPGDLVTERILGFLDSFGTAQNRAGLD